MKRLLIVATAFAAGMLARRWLDQAPAAPRLPRFRAEPDLEPQPLGYAATVSGVDEALGVMAQFDEHQIACAELALERELDDATLGLAERLRKEHADQLEETRARLAERSTEPRLSEAVAQFEARCLARQEALAEAGGEDFAAVYLERVADEHGAMVDLIDRSLLPAVTEPAIRELLRRHRAHAVSHGAEARMLH